MRIMMMTNTYLPHVGGVARSVTAFSDAYRQLGHDVVVIAPEFEGSDPDEQHVVRVAAIQKFNGSDFSLMLPDSNVLDTAVASFQPEIIHSHHPFLVGSAALRLAGQHSLPLVFTHHTMYEQYTHYAPGDSPLLKRFVTSLSTHYANACQRVIAPSESIAEILVERGVTEPIEVIATGVRNEYFKLGHGAGFRAAMGIPRDAFVIGHVGRLAHEKNLKFLAEALIKFLHERADALALIVGCGPCANEMRALAKAAGVGERFIFTGVLDHPLLASAYRAMDVFAFTSKSETQGMVLTEAMAAAVPVVALEAPGVREVVKDGANGRMLTDESIEDFVAALAWCADLSALELRRLRRHARTTAEHHSIEQCARRALAMYATVQEEFEAPEAGELALWSDAIKRISAEWTVLKGIGGAAGRALVGTDPVSLAAAS